MSISIGIPYRCRLPTFSVLSRDSCVILLLEVICIFSFSNNDFNLLSFGVYLYLRIPRFGLFYVVCTRMQAINFDFRISTFYNMEFNLTNTFSIGLLGFRPAVILIYLEYIHAICKLPDCERITICPHLLLNFQTSELFIFEMDFRYFCRNSLFDLGQLRFIFVDRQPICIHIIAQCDSQLEFCHIILGIIDHIVLFSNRFLFDLFDRIMIGARILIFIFRIIHITTSEVDIPKGDLPGFTIIYNDRCNRVIGTIFLSWHWSIIQTGKHKLVCA